MRVNRVTNDRDIIFMSTSFLHAVSKRAADSVEKPERSDSAESVPAVMKDLMKETTVQLDVERLKQTVAAIKAIDFEPMLSKMAENNLKMGSEVAVGRTVRMHNLTSRRELNGKMGSLVKWDAEQKKWSVRPTGMASGGVLVDPNNLELLRDKALPRDELGLDALGWQLRAAVRDPSTWASVSS